MNIRIRRLLAAPIVAAAIPAAAPAGTTAAALGGEGAYKSACVACQAAPDKRPNLSLINRRGGKGSQLRWRHE